MSNAELTLEAFIAAAKRLDDPAYRAKLDAEDAAVRASIKPEHKPVPCHRCRGKGNLSCFHHRCGGICFHCNGSGHEHNA
jgi:hypothetical protein